MCALNVKCDSSVFLSLSLKDPLYFSAALSQMRCFVDLYKFAIFSSTFTLLLFEIKVNQIVI